MSSPFFSSRLTVSRPYLSLSLTTIGVCRPGLGRGRGRSARRAAVAGTSCTRAQGSQKAEASDAALHLFRFFRKVLDCVLGGKATSAALFLSRHKLFVWRLRVCEQQRFVCACIQSCKVGCLCSHSFADVKHNCLSTRFVSNLNS